MECVDQIYFLLEIYPTTDKYVDQFVSHFTQTTIENSKTQNSHGVSQHKIHAAAARARNPLRAPNSDFDETDKKNKQLIENIWTSLCNSVHSNYSEVMQCYGGRSDDPKFQLGGVPSKRMIEMNAQWIPEAIGITTGALHLMADRFKLDSLKMKIKDKWLDDGSLRP